MTVQINNRTTGSTACVALAGKPRRTVFTSAPCPSCTSPLQQPGAGRGRAGREQPPLQHPAACSVQSPGRAAEQPPAAGRGSSAAGSPHAVAVLRAGERQILGQNTHLLPVLVHALGLLAARERRLLAAGQASVPARQRGGSSRPGRKPRLPRGRRRGGVGGAAGGRRGGAYSGSPWRLR